MFVESVLGMMIGLTAVLGGFIVVIVIVLAALRNRRFRLDALHKERMLAIEKGQPVPTDLLIESSRRRPYVAGLVWAAVGAGLLLWSLGDTDSDIRGFGFVALLVGIGLLVGDWLSAKREARQRSGSSSYPGVGTDYRSGGNPS